MQASQAGIVEKTHPWTGRVDVLLPMSGNLHEVSEDATHF